MRILHHVAAIEPHANGLDATLDDGWRLRLRAVSDTLFRIVVEPTGGLPVDRTWMIAPAGDVPWEGRDRESLADFSPPAIQIATVNGATTVSAGHFRVTLESAPVRLSVEQMVTEGDGVRHWRPWIDDRPTGGFALMERGARVRHLQRRDPGERYFGLGDKTGPLDRHGRRYRVLQLDALGYDAEIGDPAYKHVPYVLVRGPNGVSGGMFYDSLAPMTFDLGCERSNYHGLYRYVEAEEPGLDLWLIAGPTVAATTRGFANLVGRPALPPLWSFGFSFTSMHHADDANGQAVIAAFADRCRAEGIPISSIHFGSGYSSRGKRRYVFTWNRAKFPDPAALFAKLKAMNLPTVANLKPVLIDDHIGYQQVRDAGGFIASADGTPVLEQFWDGMGSFLDFTNPVTIRWWQQNFKAQVLEVGFDAGWNDNNEYEIGREDATASGFGRRLSGPGTRPLHALLMTRATHEATLAHAPAKRPFTISRAGPPGIQRYGETWSGDNATSWHTLKWNLRNGLSMALSGLGKLGHDIGGFTGPRPDAELLCRWVEMMALHPRAVMNSWKPDAAPDWRAATHPWTYPEVLEPIKAALHLRTRFLPVLYTAMHRAHRDGTPLIRPLFHDFEADPRCFDEHDAMMVGPDVLFSPVVAQGATTKVQYLPAGPAGWIDYHTGLLHPAGREATVPAPLGRPPLFVRVGGALMLASETPVVKPQDAPARLLYLATDAASGTGHGHHVEDDGESFAWRDGALLDLGIALNWDAQGITATLIRQGGTWPLPDPDTLTIVAPRADGRPVMVAHG